MSDAPPDEGRDQAATTEGPPSTGPTDRQRVAQGSRWGIVSGAAEQIGSMGATVVLARLLDPHDFGVVAGATLLVGLLNLVGHVGLGASLIKRRSIEEPVSSTVFWAACVLGATLTGALVLAAPLLALALKQPDITPYARGLAPLLAISMVANVSEGRLLRDLRYRWVYTADLVTVAIYVTVTLSLALLGAGAWSMVIGRVVGEAVAATVLVASARWRPRWVFDWAVIREDLRFNRSYLSVQVSNFATKNVDYWVVSRRLGTSQLGVYYVAFVLPTVLRQRMAWLGTQILMPVMARAADERNRLLALYRESLEVLCFAALPLLTGVALTAPQIIGIAFGPSWTGAVTPLRWLAAAAALEVSTTIPSTMFLALGRPQVASRTMIVRLVLMVAFLSVAVWRWGTLSSIAAAVTVATALSAVIPHAAAQSEQAIPVRMVGRWLRPILAADAAMVVVVLALIPVVGPLSLVPQAAILAGAGAAVFLGSAAVFDLPLTRRMWRVARGLAWKA